MGSCFFATSHTDVICVSSLNFFWIRDFYWAHTGKVLAPTMNASETNVAKKLSVKLRFVVSSLVLIGDVTRFLDSSPLRNFLTPSSTMSHSMGGGSPPIKRPAFIP
ncbi:hypothetical protein YC2023_001488 [Brassica napus]